MEKTNELKLGNCHHPSFTGPGYSNSRKVLGNVFTLWALDRSRAVGWARGRCLLWHSDCCTVPSRAHVRSQVHAALSSFAGSSCSSLLVSHLQRAQLVSDVLDGVGIGLHELAAQLRADQLLLLLLKLLLLLVVALHVEGGLLLLLP